jgi:group I intron endonuclease
MQARNVFESPKNWAEIDRSADCVIYCIRHIESGAEYIGSTSRPLRQRLKEHRKDVRLGSLHPLHQSIKTDGWNAFCIEILKYSTRDNLRTDEIQAINSRPSLFNQAKGSKTPSAGWSHTDQAIAKMRSSKVGDKNPASRGVIVDGVTYTTAKECCKIIGVSFPTLRSRLIDVNFANYVYAEAVDA